MTTGDHDDQQSALKKPRNASNSSEPEHQQSSNHCNSQRETQEAYESAVAVEISDQELELCVQVLRRFHDENGLKQFQTPRFKALRKALLPLMQDMRSRLYYGKDVDHVERQKAKKKSRMIEKARQKAMDQNFINNTKLRAERLEKLGQLMASNPLLAPVPDGVAREGNSSVKAIENGSQHAANAPFHAPSEQVTPEATTAQEEQEEKKELFGDRSCYCCKTRFKQLHHFYDRFCPECASLNYEKRFQQAELNGRTAIVTGARVKIGFEIALKLLRCGACVIATSRFPKDAAVRFAAEQDFAQWQDRLHVYGLDFRDLGVLESFMDHVEQKFGCIDILINNATQTVRRPVFYYRHLIENEVKPMEETPENIRKVLVNNHQMISDFQKSLPTSSSQAPNLVAATTATSVQEEKPTEPTSNDHTMVCPSGGDVSGVSRSVLLSQMPLLPEDKTPEATNTCTTVSSSSSSTSSSVTSSVNLYPQGQYDVNNQQVDLRQRNSWVLKLHQVETMELAEVFAINAMAPFILNRRAIALLEKSNFEHKFIVNVSAMEGKFYRAKSPNHPHTNMAKAAVNMMTRTCAEDLAKNKNIFMNSVDTGWINDENPRDTAVRIAKTHNFQTPLDEIDAAARVLDPILSFLQPSNTSPIPVYGQFLKDYRVSEW